MRMLSYVFETSLRFSDPVSDHSFVLRCLPKSTNTQKVMEAQVFTNPRIQLTEQVDGFGNIILSGYCPQEHDTFDFYASGLAMAASENVGPTPAHPMFLQFTRLTLPNSEMREAALGVAEGVLGRKIEHVQEQMFYNNERWAIAKALNSYVYDHFEYIPGVTNTHTTAAEAFALGRGVCQDYSHVLISLCRVLGIPARYVTGLMRGEGATHAWTEFHDGFCWRGLDPTHNRLVDDTYLLFATGRDFEDCPIERGVFRGDAEQEQTVSSTVVDGTGAVSSSSVIEN